MCDFCNEFKSKQGARTRIVRSHAGVNIFPTLGCFVDGYLLAVPKQCCPSVALLETEARNSLLVEAMTATKELEPYYGGFIIAEHGSGSTSDLGASCMDHTHLHLIPMADGCPDVLDAYLRTGGDPSLSGSREVFEKIGSRPYVSLSIEPDRYMVWLNVEKFQRQFVRQVCAGLLGMEAQYNWRVHPFVDGMLRTKILSSRALADASGRKAA